MQTTVLVVHDIPEVVKLVATMLCESGYRVIEATTGSDALRILESEPVDAAVANLGMQDVSGPDLARRAWESVPELGMVFLAARPAPGEFPCDMLCRARIVTKPSAKALRTAIEQALGGRYDATKRVAPPTFSFARNATKPGLRTGLSVLLGL